MIPEQFAILTVVLSFLGGMNYIVGTLRGETQPNRMTWGLLTLFMGIVLVAGVSAGVGWPLASVGIATFNAATIFMASFINPKAYWKTERRDYAFGAVALIGLLLWRTTGNPELAIAFSIAADFASALPTIIKSYKQPESENGKTFAIWTFAHTITLLIIKDWSFAAYAFPLYLVFFNGLIAYFVLSSKKRQ